MLEKIEEAFRALGRIRHVAKHDDYVEENAQLVTSALEAAQREAEAWKAIEAWLLFAGRDYDLAVGVDDDGGWYARALFDQYEDPDRLGFDYSPYETRLEALEAAADWCRKQVK